MTVPSWLLALSAGLPAVVAVCAALGARRRKSPRKVVFDRDDWEEWAGNLYKGPPPPREYR